MSEVAVLGCLQGGEDEASDGPTSAEERVRLLCRKVDVRLPGKRILNSHNAKPVHLIVTMMN